MVGGAVSEDRCSDLRCGWNHLGDGSARRCLGDESRLGGGW